MDTQCSLHIVVGVVLDQWQSVSPAWDFCPCVDQTAASGLTAALWCDLVRAESHTAVCSMSWQRKTLIKNDWDYDYYFTSINIKLQTIGWLLLRWVCHLSCVPAQDTGAEVAPDGRWAFMAVTLLLQSKHATIVQHIKMKVASVSQSYLTKTIAPSTVHVHGFCLAFLCGTLYFFH